MLAAPEPPLAALAVELDLLLLPPQASRIIAAIPAAPPLSAVRRVSWRHRLTGVSSSLRSSHSRRSTASSKISDICTPLQDGYRPRAQRSQTGGGGVQSA